MNARERLKRVRERTTSTTLYGERELLPISTIRPLVASTSLLERMGLTAQIDKVLELIVEMCSASVGVQPADDDKGYDVEDEHEVVEPLWISTQRRPATQYCLLCERDTTYTVEHRDGFSSCDECGYVFLTREYGPTFQATPDVRRTDTSTTANLLHGVPRWLQNKMSSDATQASRQRGAIRERVQHWAAYLELDPEAVERAVGLALRYGTLRPVTIAAALLRQQIVPPSTEAIVDQMRKGAPLEAASASAPPAPFKCDRCGAAVHTWRSARYHCRRATVAPRVHARR